MLLKNGAMKSALVKMMVVATLSVAGLLAMACEQGWDVQGEVVIGPELDQGRLLTVVVFSADRIKPDEIPRHWDVVLEDEPFSPSPMAFRHFEFGCRGDKALVIAWAPDVTTDAPAASTWSKPTIGDYFATTGPIDKTGCGWSGTQYVSLILKELK